MRLDGDQWQVQDGVPGRFRQADRGGAQAYHQRQFGLRDMGQADDPQTAHFQQAGQGLRRAGQPIQDVHPVIGNEGEAAVQQTQQKVRFARSGRPDQEHARTTPRSAASMHLHRVAI